MKKILLALIACLTVGAALAQSLSSGTCGKDVRWTFDGKTLYIQNVSKHSIPTAIKDYDTNKHKAPWIAKNLNVRSVRIGQNITGVGSCAFTGMNKLTEVIFDDNVNMNSIGWGAFLNCKNLVNISLPQSVRMIGTIAFANCTSLNAIRIPAKCIVQDQAFLNCTGVRSINVSSTALLGQYVFANEEMVDGKVRHSLYNHEIIHIPADINTANCHIYGLSKDAVKKLSYSRVGNAVNYDLLTADVDSTIPISAYARNTTYALIIGNQDYRFAPEVPYAIHDARVFGEYCEYRLGIPNSQIHRVENATKYMIMEEELEWLNSISDRENKCLIVYYAGHGVPDTKVHNKAYMLPTDVLGSKPQNGIDMTDFYAMLGDLKFQQTTVFMDACFSGITRNNESVTEGTRGVEIEAEEATISNDNIVVFSAAQGNETAQGYPQQGHGLFTYYLLKGLQNEYYSSNFGTLADYIKSNVSEKAPLLKLKKSQTPTVSASSNVGENWRNQSF